MVTCLSETEHSLLRALVARHPYDRVNLPIPQLATEAGLSVRTVYRKLPALRNFGLISYDNNTGRSRSHTFEVAQLAYVVLFQRGAVRYELP